MKPYKLLTVRDFRSKFVWDRVNFDFKIKENKTMCNKENRYNYAAFAVFTSLIIAALIVFSKAVNADPNYICYVTIGAIIANAIATYFVFTQIKSPEELELESERRYREKDSTEQLRREELESVWRSVDRVSDQVEELREEVRKNKKK